jgi:hypothetical protein
MEVPVQNLLRTALPNKRLESDARSARAAQPRALGGQQYSDIALHTRFFHSIVNLIEE